MMYIKKNRLIYIHLIAIHINLIYIKNFFMLPGLE